MDRQIELVGLDVNVGSLGLLLDGKTKRTQVVRKVDDLTLFA